MALETGMFDAHDTNFDSTACFTDLDQGSDIIGKFSLPKSMKLKNV